MISASQKALLLDCGGDFLLLLHFIVFYLYKTDAAGRTGIFIHHLFSMVVTFFVLVRADVHTSVHMASRSLVKVYVTCDAI